MIISRTPFRISFAGGGSDLEAFYRRQEGCALSTSINKYVYVLINPSPIKNYNIIRCSLTEYTHWAYQIKDPIVRHALSLVGINTGIEIVSVSDIPAGTGLGSSSAFTTGLIYCLYKLKNNFVSKEDLAQTACHIEIEELKEPIGKQDQYAVAYGGLNFIRFHPDGKVSIEPIVIPDEKMAQLQNNLLMFFTGRVHKSRSILTEQRRNILSCNDKFHCLSQMTQLAKDLKEIICHGDLDDFGKILHEGWMRKKSMAKNISNDCIDDLYNRGIKEGKALGGKLCGAGGGGYLLFYCLPENQPRLRRNLKELEEFYFEFDQNGSTIIFNKSEKNYNLF